MEVERKFTLLVAVSSNTPTFSPTNLNNIEFGIKLGKFMANHSDIEIKKNGPTYSNAYDVICPDDETAILFKIIFEDYINAYAEEVTKRQTAPEWKILKNRNYGHFPTKTYVDKLYLDTYINVVTSVQHTSIETKIKDEFDDQV